MPDGICQKTITSFNEITDEIHIGNKKAPSRASASITRKGLVGVTQHLPNLVAHISTVIRGERVQARSVEVFDGNFETDGGGELGHEETIVVVVASNHNAVSRPAADQVGATPQVAPAATVARDQQHGQCCHDALTRHCKFHQFGSVAEIVWFHVLPLAHVDDEVVLTHSKAL